MKGFARKWHALTFVLISILAAGCGSQTEPTPEPEPPPTEEVVVVVVTATEPPATSTPQVITVVVTATEQATATDAPPEETLAASATPVPPSATTVPASPTTLAPSCSTRTALRLRSGPGEIYGILSVLAAGTQVSPAAHVGAGFPAGPWLSVTAGSRQGWISASPQFLECNIEPASLPAPAAIPPTPTLVPSPTALPPTPTPVVIAQLPISIGQPSNANNADAGDFPQGRVDWYLETSDEFLFRFYVADLDAGDYDGAGIAEVLLQVRDEEGNLVDERREQSAGYCMFGGGEPFCNPWVIENGVYRWHSTGEPVEEGTYALSVSVFPEDDDRVWTWELGTFPVDVPEAPGQTE